jgi:hypothetical protein
MMPTQNSWAGGEGRSKVGSLMILKEMWNLEGKEERTSTSGALIKRKNFLSY